MKDVDARDKPGHDDLLAVGSTIEPPLLVARLEVALAVIAALRAARRAVAAGLGLVARARLLAAGALHQHAAALAVGDQAALAGGLERFFAARRAVVFTLACR